MLFYFCIMVHNGVGHILLFDFYELTLIHLTGPLSQVVQIMCNVWYIYIYISAKEGFFSWGLKRACTLESTYRLNLGCRKRRAHWTQIFIPSWTKHILGHQWSTKTAFHGINQGKHFINCHFTSCFNVYMWSYVV